MKKIILFFALTFAASAVELKSVHFLIGFNVNEHCFFAHTDKEYGKILLHNINKLSIGIEQKEIKELLEVLNIPTDSFVENFKICRKVRNAIETVLAKEKNSDWADYIFGVLLSEIATYKSVDKPVKQYMPLLERIGQRFKELDRTREAMLIEELVYLENRDALTIEQFAAIAKRIVNIYGEGLGDEIK